ncbi:(1-_4)-alpha-D-glucan 1-alpha-D-glucosylmutase [Ancylobacter sp. 3268]|uniref:malto-oligosyltrehalose synthase n=1 Tax=Ancylobacter sp. 3268 TaxID=2817752 RepID=UPI00286586F3|nr:malto-oligosyltrehalose synthase [Ancylobacter sp. 3268]MDR6953336.1 (1->4)-alpha-D-glucan 1-alpha-D-glucosylmutase [Ancylobacter sp. 3268]
MNPSAAAPPELLATYRLQFHRGFTFADAEALVPYFARLGISHLYASPITMAVPGSTHGYDVADPTRINPELGGEDGFERLAAALATQGMGVLLDIVPNHMAASSHNPFWMGMLEFGPSSPDARLFDVNWTSGPLLLPVLGEPLQATLAAGALSLRADYDTGRIVVAYADRVFPLRPESVAGLLDAAAGMRPGWAEMASDFRALSAASSTSLHRAREALRSLDTTERAALEAVLAEADLAALLEAQHWRLAWWRTAAHDLNYRRFFNITDLAGVRVEDPEVFELVHRLPLDLLRRGLIHGLRIDHIDGLLDPGAYCERLRQAVGEGIPIFLEKILEPGETLRPWSVDGTTGYERLNDINGLFIDAQGYAALEDDLRARHLLIGTPASRLADAKRTVLETSLAAEVDVLVGLAREGLDADIHAGDITEAAIRQAVLALLTHCPVYRSYATFDAHDDEDEAVWDAIRTRIEAVEDPLTAAAGRLLVDRLKQPQRESDRLFRLRFQQLSGPTLAKGFEDTELYRTPVLLAVNEVGGSLDHPARNFEELHEISRQRAIDEARDLTPLATHDTKRGPGTRARLAALSFAPERWLDFLEAARPACEHLSAGNGHDAAPDALDRHLILQTLLSAWPITAERMATYLTKALREAKRHTSWERPNEAYERAGIDLASRLIETSEAAPFRADLERLLAALNPAARIVGLAQLVLQHTLPGTPDIYQGTELPDFSLVDPDNRRPVDWPSRSACLDGIGTPDPADAEHFALLRLLLAQRRRNRAFAHGDYRPLETGSSPWRWFGFERRHQGHVLRVIVPTRIPWRDALPATIALETAEMWDGDWNIAGPCSVEKGSQRLELPTSWPFIVAEKA